MFDEISGVVDHPGEENFSLRQLYLLPNLPFMAMARVGRFDGDSRDVGFKHDIDDIAQCDVAVVRAFVVAPANVDAHLFGWDRLERVIETFDMAFDDSTKLLDAQAGVVRIGAGGQVRAVE